MFFMHEKGLNGSEAPTDDGTVVRAFTLEALAKAVADDEGRFHSSALVTFLLGKNRGETPEEDLLILDDELAAIAERIEDTDEKGWFRIRPEAEAGMEIEPESLPKPRYQPSARDRRELEAMMRKALGSPRSILPNRRKRRTRAGRRP